MTGIKHQPLAPDKIRKKRESYSEKVPTPPDDDDETQKSLEELQKLSIKDEELKKIRQDVLSVEPKPLIQKKFRVKVEKPVEISKKKRPTAVVAKLASPDSICKSPNFIPGLYGPQFDSIGRLVSHSIAGDYADFYSMASNVGEAKDLPLPQNGYVPLKKADAQQTTRSPLSTEAQLEPVSCEQMKALRNWQVKMAQRRLQQKYVCKILERQPQDLVMNQGDYIRNRVETCEILDRVLAQVSTGKGYRNGSEFWMQQERFGDELNGIFATLNLTQKGQRPSIDYVGVPPFVRQEKGMIWHPANTPRIQHPWDENLYLRWRKRQLWQLIEEEKDSHQPDYEGLEVVGLKPEKAVATQATRDQLIIHENSYSCDIVDNDLTTSYSSVENTSLYSPVNQSVHTPVSNVKYFPALIFDGQQLQWLEKSDNRPAQLKLLERCVIFETLLHKQVESYLDIVNNGTTAIFYQWKKLPKYKPFGIFHHPVQRFYFNESDGVILPGMSRHFPFTFKSSQCGIHSEQWLFETHPILQGGAPVILTLRGTIIPEDNFCEERKNLRKHLERLQQEHLAERIVNDLCMSVCSVDPAPSLMDSYVTQEDHFRQKNPHLHYDYRSVKEMKQIYSAIFPDAEKDEYIWNFSVTDLAQIISDLDDSEEKENYLNQMEESIYRMQFQTDVFKSYDLYQCGYSLLGDSFNLLSIRLWKIWQEHILDDEDVCSDAIEETEADSSLNKRQQSLMETQSYEIKPETSDPPPRITKKLESVSLNRKVLEHNLIALCSEKMYVEVYDTLSVMIDRMERIFSSMQHQQLLNNGYNGDLSARNKL